MSKIRKINPKTVRLADIETRLKKSNLSSKEIEGIRQSVAALCYNCVAKSSGKVDKKSMELRSKLLKAGYSNKEIDTIFDARKI